MAAVCLYAAMLLSVPDPDTLLASPCAGVHIIQPAAVRLPVGYCHHVDPFPRDEPDGPAAGPGLLFPLLSGFAEKSFPDQLIDKERDRRFRKAQVSCKPGS